MDDVSGSPDAIEGEVQQPPVDWAVVMTFTVKVATVEEAEAVRDAVAQALAMLPFIEDKDSIAAMVERASSE